MKAWFFSKGNELRYGDKRFISLGTTHTVSTPIKLCHNGLHASVRPLDALKYAPGPVLWRVDLSGSMDMGSDKIAASERTYLDGGIDVSDTLRKFARLCALDNIDKWDAPSVVIEYLKTGDKDLRSAAESAARSAAESAAWSAARSAAESAAWSAARSAAESAARSAARSAAWSAARSAAEEKQNGRLYRMLLKEINKSSTDIVNT